MAGKHIGFHYEHISWDWNGTLLNDVLLCVDIANQLLANHSDLRQDRAVLDCQLHLGVQQLLGWTASWWRMGTSRSGVWKVGWEIRLGWWGVLRSWCRGAVVGRKDQQQLI